MILIISYMLAVFIIARLFEMVMTTDNNLSKVISGISLIVIVLLLIALWMGATDRIPLKY